jgi:hypothetical protein
MNVQLASLFEASPQGVRIVVACTYGADHAPSRQILKNAIEVVGAIPSLLICLYEQHPSLGISFEQSKQIREAMIPAGIFFTMLPVVNSISEASEVREFIDKQKLAVDSIVVVCDTDHAMRLQYIWRHFFPHSQIRITFCKVPCKWGLDQPYVSQRSRLRWWVINVVGLLAMKVLGIERVSKAVQSS